MGKKNRIHRHIHIVNTSWRQRLFYIGLGFSLAAYIGGGIDHDALSNKASDAYTYVERVVDYNFRDYLPDDDWN